MRKKLFIGMFLAAIASVVAGEFLFNRSGAQDAPKKADEKFVIPPPTVTLPALPTAPKETLTFPPLEAKALTRQPDAGLTLPPPVVNAPIPPMLPTPQTVTPPLEPMKAQPFPPAAPEPPQVVAPKPTVVEPKKHETLPVQDLLVFPPLTKDANVKPAISSDDPSLAKPTPPNWNLPPQPVIPPSSGHVPPTQPIAQEVAKIKDCPWSLQVEMADGQTIVTATVNKKHEFKIVCKSLDLQTAKGTLKASGKVTITGDTFNGTCEHLAIPLMEDRLVLEGGAAVTIQKFSTHVSDTKSAAFELKGETLNLRISELQPERFLQTSMRKAIDVNVKQAAVNAPASSDKQWTPYGTLRRVNTKLQTENGVWQLEDRAGKVIATLVARTGGSLSQHEGQTISVYGTAEQINGERCLRVTHIALP